MFRSLAVPRIFFTNPRCNGYAGRPYDSYADQNSAPTTRALPAPPGAPSGRDFHSHRPAGIARRPHDSADAGRGSALLTRRGPLRQLSTVADRRPSSLWSFRNPGRASAPESRPRLALLDQRILQIEDRGDLAKTGAIFPAASPCGRYHGGRDDEPPAVLFEEGMAVGGVSVFLSCARCTLRAPALGAARCVSPPTTSMDSARLERLEQGMKRLQSRFERVSEGQRFVTRILSNRRRDRRWATAKPSRYRGVKRSPIGLGDVSNARWTCSASGAVRFAAVPA